MEDKTAKINRIIGKLEQLNDIRKRKQDTTLDPPSKSGSR